MEGGVLSMAGNRKRDRQRGVVTIEAAVLFGTAIAAFVALAIYVQRGYQGYLYNQAQSQGTQFDPADYDERRSIRTTQIQDVEVFSGQAAITMAPASERLQWLPSLPGGGTPAKSMLTKVKVVTDWDVCRSGGYGGAIAPGCK